MKEGSGACRSDGAQNRAAHHRGPRVGSLDQERSGAMGFPGKFRPSNSACAHVSNFAFGTLFDPKSIICLLTNAFIAASRIVCISPWICTHFGRRSPYMDWKYNFTAGSKKILGSRRTTRKDNLCNPARQLAGSRFRLADGHQISIDFQIQIVLIWHFWIQNQISAF